MKSYYLVFFILIISSCSLDNKTGIWKDASDIPLESKASKTIEPLTNNKKIVRYEDVFVKNKKFNKQVKRKDNSILKIDVPSNTDKWLEQYGSKTNNISNFSYSGYKSKISKSRKLSKPVSNRNIIFYDNNLITYDHKGRIFIYSLNQRKKVFIYDFYKKNFKNYKKKIYLTVNKKILYAADNLGYIYAIDLNSKSLIWAKNYGISFRSNIKVVNEEIFVANQDNVIYSINKKNGKKNWQYATSITFLKSDFENTFAIDKINKNLMFLNTSGQLYSINYSANKINWVLNFKSPSLVESSTDLFLSQPIVIKNNNLIVTTNNSVHSYNYLTASRNWTFSSDSILKPILTINHTYIFSKNNFLICLDNNTGDVLWARNIYRAKQLRNLEQELFLISGGGGDKIKNKMGKIRDFKIANNDIYLFFKNGYLITFDYSNGNLKDIKRISKNGISTRVVFLKTNMFLIDNDNKLLKFN